MSPLDRAQTTASRRGPLTPHVAVRPAGLELVRQPAQNNPSEERPRMAEVDSFVCPACGQITSDPSHLRDGYCAVCQDRTGVLGITAELIMSRTASYFQITVEQLLSPDRSAYLSGPRQIAMYLCRELTDLSLPKIGELFQRDHTTVMYGVRKIEGLVREHPRYRQHTTAIAGWVAAQADRYDSQPWSDWAYAR